MSRSLEAFKRIVERYGNTGSLEGTYNDFLIIKKDLKILEFIKTHYVMNGFNELIPKYDSISKFDELEEWLKNGNN